MAIFYGVLVLSWLVSFVLLFTDRQPDKFGVGCAYLIVILVFLEKLIESVRL